MAAKTTTAVAATAPQGLPVFEGALAVLEGDDDLTEIIRENMGEEGLRPSDVTRVTFPRETPAWMVDGVVVSELRGVPLKQAVNRTFYLDSYSAGSNEQPDCASYDGVSGSPKAGTDPHIFTPAGSEVTYGGNCARCPLNQWDSAWNDKGEATRGKACREYRQIAFLPTDAALPIIVRIPPTQLRAWHDFCANVTKARRYIWETVASLTIGSNRDGTLFLQAALVGVLPDETAARVHDAGNAMNLLAAPAPTALLDEAPAFTDEDLEPSDLPF